MSEPQVAVRKLDLASIKGLAHPIRVRIFDALSVHGASTASGLAERLGESSGATSYHLRQLERHGFVREVDGKGTARERWWERVPGGITLSAREAGNSPSSKAATLALLKQWEQSRSVLLDEFVQRGYDNFGEEWIEASTTATANLRLTAEQLDEVVKSWEMWADATLQKYRGKNPVGARPVQIHFNGFPVVGGDVTEEES
ncbi:MAG: helix-turn-helix domain-containing protein [Rhodoglobus sp.]|nr:helix-turn-helix domain-containing protein [Rhodoglobus sp.]